MPFPAPVGGIALPSDFAPSVLFVVLYALLVPLVIYRAYDRRSRTPLLFGTAAFSIESHILPSCRPKPKRRSATLQWPSEVYASKLWGWFIGLASDLVGLLRCLLVNPTFGPEKWEEAPASNTKESYFQVPEQGEEDHPKERFWARRYCELTNLAFLTSSIPGAVAGAEFAREDFSNDQKGRRAMVLRYASTSVALFLMLMIQLGALWGWRKQRRHCKKAISLILSIRLLTTLIAVYRLSVMYHTSPSLDSTGPGTLNSPGAKASFYILHILPEWIASVIMLAFPMRKIFGTGFFGDWRGVDDGPKEIARREKRKAKRAAKKAGKSGEKGNEVGVELVSVERASE